MTAKEAKERLKTYGRINRRIDRLLERKARLFARITSAPVQSNGGASPGVHDRIGDGTIALIHYEERINAQIDKLTDEEAYIERVLGHIGGTQAELLEMMYIDGKKLGEAADELHYGYRQACRLHGQALLSAAEIMGKDVL